MTAFDRVLDALHDLGMKVKGGPSQVRAQCPVHDSAGLTLSVRRGDDKAMVHCFAGCEYDDLLDALGLARRDLFDGELPKDYVPRPRRVLSPWDIVTDGPGWDHLLDRIAREHALEADPGIRERARAADQAVMGDG